MTLGRLIAAGTVALGLAIANLASATPIVGVPVAGIGAPVDPSFGHTGSDGTVYYYIPLEDDGQVYGVDGGGLSSDSCTYPGSCDGGSLSMTLFFADLYGAADVKLQFADLDESGFNDPWFFWENIALYDSGGIEITEFELVGDELQQQLTFSTDFGVAAYVELLFGSDFDADTPHRTYGNRAESLLATATGMTIPEPGTFALFVFGIAAITLMQRRRKTASA